MTVIWTHRGDGIENTLPAFDLAWSKGITHFETDVQATRDGILVLAHDENIKRITGKSIKISDLTLSQLSRYKIQNQANWTTLDELVHSYPEAKISIDLKSNKSTSCAIDWLKGRRSTDNFIFGSFNHQRITALRTRFPLLNTSLTPPELVRIKIGKSIGEFNALTKFAMIPLSYFGIPISTRKTIARLKEMGIPIHVWTLNDEKSMKLAKESGITGIITDNLDLAKSVLING